jgi:hypothetical protein
MFNDDNRKINEHTHIIILAPDMDFKCKCKVVKKNDESKKYDYLYDVIYFRL